MCSRVELPGPLCGLTTVAVLYATEAVQSLAAHNSSYVVVDLHLLAILLDR